MWIILQSWRWWSCHLWMIRRGELKLFSAWVFLLATLLLCLPLSSGFFVSLPQHRWDPRYHEVKWLPWCDTSTLEQNQELNWANFPLSLVPQCQNNPVKYEPGQLEELLNACCCCWNDLILGNWKEKLARAVCECVFASFPGLPEVLGA